MILTTVRHGRTSRDLRNLKAHLSRSVGQTARVVAIGGCPLTTADDALAYMEAMRDGSMADVACHHVTISPRGRLDEAQRDEAVRRILAAYGAADHAFVLWEHDGKERAVPGGSPQHFHLVIGHVGDDLRALDDSRSYLKLEAVARSLEADFGEPLTVSRRTAAVAAELRRVGRPDVADLLAEPAQPPRSSMSSKTRAVAARAGLDLPKAKAAVSAAWSVSDSPAAFMAALADQGFTVVPGEKEAVYVVTAGDVTIGALDRLTKQKRAYVAEIMKGFENGRRDLEACEGSVRPDKGCSECSGEIGAAAAAPGRSPDGRAQPDRKPSGSSRDDPERAAPPASVHDRAPREGRPDSRLAQARLTASIFGFSVTPAMRREMDFVQIDALKHRKLSGGLLSSQLARLDWRRLRKLADDVLDFAQDARRRIRFGSFEPVQLPSVRIDLSPDGIRRRLLAARAATPAAPSDDYVPSTPRR